ncbi:MAG: hypothetical protein HFJ59_04135 [Clostridia bacterium]|nr:hypothetical protein [Clostridia bacterium]
MKLNILDKMLLYILKKYSYKIYRRGVQDGFNWNNKINSQGCNKAVPILKIKRKDIK